jgi:hypothetical protein
LAIALIAGLAAGGCARLPETTRIVHEDSRAMVKLQQEVHPPGYSHPAALVAGEVAAILRGFSIRQQVSLPLRWFAEEAPPKKIFREDELLVLAPYLAEALQRAGPSERIYFELFAPGFNPRYDRDVTAGWIALRDPLFFLTIEHFHAQQPTTRFSPYDFNYPTPPAEPGSYLVYFEPGRYWVLERESSQRAVDFRQFLRSAQAP